MIVLKYIPLKVLQLLATILAKLAPNQLARLCEALLYQFQTSVGQRQSQGLPKEVRLPLWSQDADLRQVLFRAIQEKARLHSEFPVQADLLTMAETDALVCMQAGFRHFYSADAKTPYSPIAGAGPWEMSTHGGLFFSVAGYGKDAFGHCPARLQAVMGRGHAIANVMTPHWTQAELIRLLANELGLLQDQFVIQMLNSGSEASGLGMTYVERLLKQRIADDDCSESTRFWVINKTGSFHGRTKPAARVSDSTQDAYEQAFLPWLTRFEVHSIPVNELAELEAIYARAEQEGAIILAQVMELVQGEGNPGCAIAPEYYQKARELTKTHGALLLVDSVQAGWRTYGRLSPLSAIEFAQCERPDIEFFSKATFGGVYPGSLLVLNKPTAELFAVGTYGNTMTSNAMACELAIEVLKGMTPAVKANIEARSQQLLAGFARLQTQYPDLIEAYQGTGLLLALKIRRHQVNGQEQTVVPVVGSDGLERQCRQAGLNIIHGGKNDYLRLTPYFLMTSDQADLVLRILDQVLSCNRAEAQ